MIDIDIDIDRYIYIFFCVLFITLRRSGTKPLTKVLRSAERSIHNFDSQPFSVDDVCVLKSIPNHSKSALLVVNPTI